MRLGQSYKREVETRCPSCGQPANAGATIDSDMPPKVGDVALCLMCGAPAVLCEDLTLRAATEAELIEFEADPHYRKARDLLHLYQRTHPPNPEQP